MAWALAAQCESITFLHSQSKADNRSHQEEGGVGGELGEDRGTSTRQSGRGDNSGKGNDSTMGKLMEKAGSAFNNENLEQKGRAKREEASDNY